MKIVEFNNQYAEKVADMWNKSNSNWGNDTDVKTAEAVIKQEASSGNIKLYLAMDNDEVVGYCSFSEYSGDEGASYLPLLNVRPDYHGKKVGKELILKVIDDAIASKWPRFDLYTWSGNIKAMPLYKKCGFFWEKKNSTVHLMNFLPYIFQTEALAEYMEKIDWYQDSKRVIDMNQDGELRGEFDMYRYDFKNNEIELSLEFERKGRGLTLIDSPDYRVEVKMDNQDLVFGETYEVTYEIINKTDKPLEISIKGKDNKNLEFDLDYTGTITDNETVKGTVFVGEIKKDQEEMKTHPVVDADVYINGKYASFKLGINPKFPIKTKMITPPYQLVKGKEYTTYIDLENNYNEAKEVKLKLKDSFVEFESIAPFTLSKKEKRSIPVKVKANDFGFYNEDIEVIVGENSFSNKLQGIFNDHANSFTADMENGAVVVSGSNAFLFEKDGKALVLINNFRNDATTAILTPQIGVPYTKELHNVEPVIRFEGNNKMVITYESKETLGAKVELHAEHYHGIAKAHYELHYDGEDKEMQIVCPVWQRLGKGYVPFDGDILSFSGYDGAGISSIEGSKVDEKWLYSDLLNTGMSWEGEAIFTDWKLTFESERKTMTKGDVLKTSEVIFSNIHKDYKEFRTYLGYTEERAEQAYLQVKTNNGNPFFETEYDVALQNLIKKSFEGTKTVDGISSEAFDVVSSKNEHFSTTLELDDRFVEVNKRLFKQTGSVDLTVEDGIHIVKNGVLEFKADAKFADTIYSLKKDGQEWIDSNYPEPKERAWWGAWTGGSTLYTRNLNDVLKQFEEKVVEFATVTDNYGNVWEGIKASVEFQKDKNLKGFRTESFFLTLPGVNVMLIATKIGNETGKLILNQHLTRMLAVKGDEPKTNMVAHLNNRQYRCFDKGVEEDAHDFVKFVTDRNDKLHVMAFDSKETLLETQTEFTTVWANYEMTIADRTSKQFGNTFVIIGDEVSKEEIIDLRNIKIEV